MNELFTQTYYEVLNIPIQQNSFVQLISNTSFFLGRFSFFFDFPTCLTENFSSDVFLLFQLYHSMTRERRLNDFLLAVTKSIFQELVSMDAVMLKIMVRRSSNRFAFVSSNAFLRVTQRNLSTPIELRFSSSMREPKNCTRESSTSAATISLCPRTTNALVFVFPWTKESPAMSPLPAKL